MCSCRCCWAKTCRSPSDVSADCAALRFRRPFWHSSAHVLGEALEALFGVRLTIGPHVEEGFYYDCYMGDRTPDRCREAPHRAED